MPGLEPALSQAQVTGVNHREEGRRALQAEGGQELEVSGAPGSRGLSHT